MASLTTTLDAEFTPTATVFTVQANGGEVVLYTKNSSSVTPFAEAGRIAANQQRLVDNVVGQVWKVSALRASGTTIAVDE